MPRKAPRGSRAPTPGVALRGGIILRVGNGKVAKLSDQAQPGSAIDLSFEQTIRGAFEPEKWPLKQHQLVMLTGGDSGYDWGFNGKPSMMHDVLFKVKQYEQVELSMHNMTSMAHPMHLHGHYFKMVAINGKRVKGPVRDTILVPPAGPQITVTGSVKRPAIYELKGETKLSEVLDDAGGIQVSAALRHISVERIAANDHRETTVARTLSAAFRKQGCELRFSCRCKS